MTTYNPDKKKIRSRRAGAAVLTGVCAAFGVVSAHAATRFEPRIGVDVTWIDNVELAPPGTPKRDELIGQALPGFRLVHDGQNLQAYADYQLQAVYFNDTHDSNEVFHQAELGVQWAAIPDWFFLDLGGSRTQNVIDPSQPANLENIFQVGNLADATAGQATPILRHTFRLAALEASYTRGFLNYSRAGDATAGSLELDDSKNESASFDLSSPDEDALWTWRMNYHHDKVDYDIAESFQYDQAQAELGFRVSPSLQLLALGGLESDPERDISSGGLESSSWQGGFAWRPSLRTELRALAGKRFFGTSYDFTLRHTGRALEADVGYHESPTTQTQSHVVRGITAPGDFPPGLGPGFSRTTSDVYLLKRLDGRVGLRGRVTDIFLSAYSEKREYFSPIALEDKEQGVDLVATRRLGPRLRLQLYAGLSDTQLREGDDFQEHTYTLALVRQVGALANITLSGNRFERSGGFRPYEANWVMVGFNIDFGGPDTVGRARAGVPAERGRGTLPTVPSQL